MFFGVYRPIARHSRNSEAHGRVHKLAKDLIKELEGDKQEFRKCV
jgi:hypothetical protein